VDVGGIDVTAKEDVEKAGLKTSASPGGGQTIIYFNTSKGTAANKAVRQALRLAFDYQGALDTIFSGQGTIANGPLPTNLQCRPDVPTAKQDLPAAKKVLADAGLSNAKLTMRFQPVFAQQAQAATLLQSNLKEIGVSLTLQPIAFADYLTSLGDFAKIPDIMLLSESSPYPDTGVMVTRTYWSKAVGTNKSAYHNPKVDSLIAAAGANPSADARCKLYASAQKLVDDDSASMALYTTQGTLGYRSDIGGTDTMAAPGGLSVPALTVGN
jgi:peptide/nickel transport system substrate-binding protein